ncbi:MAG: PAS domain S-box protein [Phycisphaerae bacterium]|nr:PAS domain S-box protein [Phycisphaerae bacterium]
MSLSNHDINAMQESLRQGEIIFNGISDGICLLDADRRIVKCNQAMADMLGKTIDECTGLVICELVHGAPGPVPNCPLHKAWLSGFRESCELRVEDKSLQITVDPLRNDKGEISSVVHIVRDITDSQKAENALRESEAEVQSIFRSAPIGIGVVRNRILTQVNERFCEMIGYSREELLDQSSRILYPTQEDYEWVGKEKYTQIKEHGKGAVETRFKCKDGKIIDVLLSSAPFDPGDLTLGVTFTAMDITDRKHAKQELLFHSVALEQSMDGIVIADLDGYIQFTNTAFAEMHQYKPHELVGKHFSIFHTEQQMKDDVEPFEKSLKKHGFAKGEINHVRRDGTVFPTTMSCSVLKGPDGNPISAVAVTADITEQKKAHAELQKAHNELEQRVKERTKDLTEANENLRQEIIQRRKVQEALGESERKFRTLAETVAAAIMIIQGDQTVYTNRAAQILTERTRDELYQIPYWELWAPEWRDIIRSRCCDRRQGLDMISRYESKMLPPSGQLRWIDQSMATVNYDGKPAVLLTALDITKRHQAEEELKAAHIQLVNARERERKTLATELHDSLAQEMVVLQLMMQRGKETIDNQEKLEVWMADAGKMCSVMITKIRSICHGLYPPTLETFGMRKALENLAEFYKVADIDVCIKSGCKKGVRFSPNIEIAMFRIAQEAISNAIRHGGALKIDIEVCFKDGILYEKIIDHGSGFDVDEKNAYGLGLRSMADRANSISGELEITSSEDETCICVTVPTNPM